MMSHSAATTVAQPIATFPTVSPESLVTWLAVPRSRYACIQSLVAIALSYELLFGNDSVVAHWVAELIAGGLLVTVLSILVIPNSALQSRWFVNGLVGLDTVLTVAAVYLSGNAREEFYLSFFLLLLIAASVRTLSHMLGLSALVSAGYGGLVVTGVVTTGELSVGPLLGLPVLLMMGVFYGLTLEELGVERRHREGLSERVAELRVQEESLLGTRDRLLHETTHLKRELATLKRGRTATIGGESQARSGREQPPSASANVAQAEQPQMKRLAGQVAVMLQDVVRQMGRETGALRVELKRDDPLYKHIDQVLVAGERTAAIAAQLERLCDSEPVKRERCSLHAVMADLELTIREMLPPGVVLSLDLCSEPVVVEATPGMVEQVVLQLVMNARDAMPTGGHLIVAVKMADGPGATGEALPRPAQLIVRDTGCGMNRDTQARLFEPFYTTKTGGGAWGMGLTNVQSLVARVGGRLAVTSQSGKGTEVTITWPGSLSPTEAKQVLGVDARDCAEKGETVMVVEEDESLRKWTMAALRRARYHVIEAHSGVEALLLAQQHRGVITLLLCNLAMPDMSGAGLAERLLSERPALKAVFTSNYPEDVIKTHRIASRFYLQKPYRQDDLLRKVRDVIGN